MCQKLLHFPANHSTPELCKLLQHRHPPPHNQLEEIDAPYQLNRDKLLPTKSSINTQKPNLKICWLAKCILSFLKFTIEDNFFMVGVTLGTFLQGSAGTLVVIELRDETAVEGVLDSVDPKSLNLQLNNVVLYRRRQKGLKTTHLPSFFVKGKYIRFVHFTNYATALHLLKQSLRKK